MRYSEEALQSWIKPLSATEETRVENTIGMIKDAIERSGLSSKYEYEIFAQGSYANNTNVKKNSDIDICIMVKSLFYCEYVDGLSDLDYNYSSSSTNANVFKNEVLKALISKFGAESVSIGNKCININSNSYHVNADVVPCFQYRNYRYIGSRSSEKFVEGIKFFTSNGNYEVINYPKVHIQNGISKNKSTHYKYKYLVRIMKHIKNEMQELGLTNERISSYLIECLVWNIPEQMFFNSNSYTGLLQQALYYIVSQVNLNWVEVSGMYYLFRSEQKWNLQDTKTFLVRMIEFLDYK